MEPVSAANYIKQQVKIVAGPLAAFRLRRYKVSWFNLDESVEQLIVPDLRERHIPDSDVTVASAWTTAPWVACYSQHKGDGYYLIQHYEVWDGLEAAVDRTWRLPLHKIVIAKWLLDKAKDFGERENATYIPNGIDFDVFRQTAPIEERFSHVVMLGHSAPWKGMADGIEALNIARGFVPDMRATVFGTMPRPETLPGWIVYTQLPNPHQLTALYNDSSIFLHPSWSEGCPAPPAEAMACGSALVAAANPGVLDYATDGVTAVTAPVKSPRLLATALLTLLKDDRLRIKIAKQGHADIKRYSWSKAEQSFERLLLQR